MSEGYQQRNDASRQRLREVVARLDDAALARRLDDGWTVGEVLAHTAQWDQIALARWQMFDREGEFVSLTSELADVINTSSLPFFQALSPAAIRELVVQAAEAVDARTASLSPEALAYLKASGKEFILERYSHREEHLDQIEEILAT